MGFGSGFRPSRTEVRASTITGGDLSQSHQFTGSVSITGSLSVNGVDITGSGGGGGSTDSFKTISVSGQPNVVADSPTDTLTLVEGSNVTITTDAGTDTITIAAAGGGGGVTNPLTDDTPLYFGTGNDSYVEYDSTGDYMVISGSANGIVLSGSNIRIGEGGGAGVPGSNIHLGDGTVYPNYSHLTCSAYARFEKSITNYRSSITTLMPPPDGGSNGHGVALQLGEGTGSDRGAIFGGESLWPDQHMYLSGTNYVEIAGGSLILNTGSVTSGSIAGLGSYLGVTSTGQVVLTSSGGGGGGGVTNPLTDDTPLYFGTGNDSYIEYDSTGDYMVISGSTNGIVLSGSNIIISGTLQGGSPLLIEGPVGINTTPSEVSLDVMHDFATVPFVDTLPSGSRGGGDRLRMPGSTYHLKEGELYTRTPNWAWVQASATASARAGSMLALGLGGDSNGAGSAGALMAGYMNIISVYVEPVSPPVYPSQESGRPLYVSPTPGKISFDAPSGSGEFVRIVGYALERDYKSEDLIIRFDPDPTWVDII